jgi:hypothetical protein
MKKTAVVALFLLALLLCITCAGFGLPLITVFGDNAPTSNYLKSSRVALVPNGVSNNGGGLYTGTTWPNNDSFTFANLALATLENGAIADPIKAGNYDTVVIMAMDFNFGVAWGDTYFNSRIQSFVNGGGKLIIYTSETTSATSFSNFTYPFTVDTPGQTGSRTGKLTNLVNDSFSSSDPADVPPAIPGAYINLQLITTQTDAVGDLTVMTSYDPHWFIDLFGTNVHNVGGPAHTYAFCGAGLIIFNGLDLDNAAGVAPSNLNGQAAINMIWWRELCSQNLNPGPNVNGLTLEPANSTDLIGTNHNVTATVRNTQNNNPIAGVLVNFSITAGPSTNLNGQGITDTNGQATFNWSSLIVGIDTLSAIVPSSNRGAPNVVTNATENWVLTLPMAVNVSPSSCIMDVGQTQSFTATPSGGYGVGFYMSFQWYVNGISQTNETSSMFSFIGASVGSFSISATVTDNSSTTSPQSNPAFVTVNADPTVSIYPVGPLTLNFGQNLTFTATAVGGTGTIHYQWYVDALTVGADSSTYTYTVAAETVTIICKVTDSASTPITSPDSNAVTVTGIPTPTPTPTPTQDPTPSPTLTASPAAVVQAEYLFRFGWIEIAIIILMAIVVSAATVEAFKHIG